MIHINLIFWYNRDKISDNNEVDICLSKQMITIRTYIETCFRNGIDIFTALTKLASRSPYTVTELLGEV
ncbi:MAG TPA: hypothetical protein DHW85_02200 [Lachnospiraceae bacterium]|nr:hypothetical protein [Lachnospiraceae bacterium]